MQLKKWMVRITLGAILVLGILGCQITDQLIAQSSGPTPTRTRTPRPTFTPIPVSTDTPMPAPTAAPTNTAAPTVKPTTRPVPSATRRPATAVPVVQPTAKPVVAGPTTSPYQWHANPPGCEHSGLTSIKAKVYGDKNDPNSGLAGVKVAMGGPGGDQYVPPVTTEWDGTYVFILSDNGQPGRVGTWYVWLIDDSGKRISDIGGPINTNNLGPDDPASCWHGWVDFWR